MVGLDQGLDHGIGGGEVAAVAGLDRGDGQGNGEVGLAAAGLAQEHDRSLFVDEPQGGEVGDELAVNRGLEVEIEVGDAAVEREAGVAHPCGQPAVSVRGGLDGDEAGEVVDVGPVLGPSLLGEGGEGSGSGVEFEVAEIALICS